MSTHYSLLPLDQVEAGAVLSDDVRDEQGVVLLSNGTLLTPSLLKSLARHGVAFVQIQLIDMTHKGNSEGNSEGSQADPQVQQQLERLKRLFRLETCDEASSLLHVYIQQYREQCHSGARV